MPALHLPNGDVLCAIYNDDKTLFAEQRFTKDEYDALKREAKELGITPGALFRRKKMAS